LKRLPVIVGLGGANAAGRISFHHAYRRLVIDRVGESDRARTYQSLAALMNLDRDPTLAETRAWIDANTLVRRVGLFDPTAVPWNRALSLQPAGAPFEFLLARRELPQHLPAGWLVTPHTDRDVRITVDATFDALLPDTRVIYC
jgi:acetoacetyl-[acyl-carrier protein] synthase